MRRTVAEPAAALIDGLEVLCSTLSACSWPMKASARTPEERMIGMSAAVKLERALQRDLCDEILVGDGLCEGPFGVVQAVDVCLVML